MTRISISDIPENRTVSNDELRRVMGGGISPGGLFEVGQQISNPASLASFELCRCCPGRIIPTVKDLTK